MRRSASVVILLAAFATGASAQVQPPAKPNANPCRDEVATALQKLRKSSWFRMDTQLITENGPTSMQVDYVLPDRMHQTVTEKLTNKTSELVLVGDHAWSKQDTGWRPVPQQIAAQLREQMDDTVLREQTDIGNYACKGRMQVEGRDVLAYRLDNEPDKQAPASSNQTFRMFYVDALTGLPSSNALLVPGHEDKPIFRTSYSFPIDMKIEPPKDVLPDKDIAAPAPAAPAPADGK
jgi:hypothetical protein